MLKVATRFTYSDTPKGILKANANKARRRQDAAEVADSLLAGLDDTPHIELTAWELDCYYPLPQKVAAALLVWDDGLDYNLDGTSYPDSPPDFYPHSYHHSVDDAHALAETMELGKRGIDYTVVEDYWVVGWDTDRIPQPRPRA